MIILVKLLICHGYHHSRPQRPRSFWSAPRMATSGKIQHRKSAIHGLAVTLRILRVKSDKYDWFWSQSVLLQSHSEPEFAILGADQKERSLWVREWVIIHQNKLVRGINVVKHERWTVSIVLVPNGSFQGAGPWTIIDNCFHHFYTCHLHVTVLQLP